MLQLSVRRIIVTAAFVAALGSVVMLNAGARGVGGGVEPANESIHLSDVAHASGIDFVHQEATLDPRIANVAPHVAALGACVSVADVNNDGWPDLYFTTSRFGAPNALYLNQKDGTFLPVDLQTPPLTDLANIFNWLGRAPGRAIALTIIRLLLLHGRRWLALIAFAIAESVASLCSGLLKTLVARPRPPGGLIHPVGSSFPSGHATYAAATCVAIVLLFTTPAPRRRVWWTLATLVTIGMAWSRTYLQVHWLSDVTAGALLGSGVSLLTFAIAPIRRRPDSSASIHASLLEDPTPQAPRNRRRPA